MCPRRATVCGAGLPGRGVFHGRGRAESPGGKGRVGTAMTSAILGGGGGLGIVLAGPIVQHLGYHWLFWLPLAAVVAAGVGTLVAIPESPVTTPGRISWFGSGLL